MVDVDTTARVWIEYEDDEWWKGYVVGENKTDYSACACPISCPSDLTNEFRDIF
jgi:hypothetical protein